LLAAEKENHPTVQERGATPTGVPLGTGKQNQTFRPGGCFDLKGAQQGSRNFLRLRTLRLAARLALTGTGTRLLKTMTPSQVQEQWSLLLWQAVWLHHQWQVLLQLAENRAIRRASLGSDI